MMLYDVLWCCMMLYDVKAVDFIAELCVFKLNAKLKPSYIPRCGVFFLLNGVRSRTLPILCIDTSTLDVEPTLTRMRGQMNYITRRMKLRRPYTAPR